MRLRAGVGVSVVFGLLLIASVALAVGSFTDDDGNTHEANIEAIAAEGITKGCNPPANDLYCPGDPVTRGQMAAFLRRAFSLPAALNDYFDDDDGTTFEGDINSLAEAGITKGCNPPDNDEYCPDGNVTRGQMAAFLRRAFDYPSSPTDFFIDDDNSIFEEDINAIGAEGVTKGCNPPANDLYCPDDLVLRDQMASFLARALDLDPIAPSDEIELSAAAGDGSSIALRADQRAVVSYRTDSGQLRIAICADRACESHTTRTLVSSGVQFDGEVALDAQERPHIPFVKDGELHLARCSDSSCDSVETQNITAGSADANVSRPSITFAADGLPIIAFVDSPWVVVAKCATDNCSISSLTGVENVELANAAPKVRLGSDELPVVSYYHAGELALRVAHCSDSVCSGGSVRTVDGGETCCVGQGHSMVIGSDGLPFISHYAWHPNDQNLVVTHCLDLTCSATFDRTIASSGNVGAMSSVAVGPDGFPSIVFRDSTNQDLRRYDCRNLNCNQAGNASYSVVSAGNVGANPQLAIADDGTSIMTYQDEGDLVLRIGQ